MLRSSFFRFFLSCCLSSALIFAPIQRAQANLASTSLGAMLGFRASGAAASASLAAVVGTGGAALVGIGLSLAAIYVYDKYISPNATSPPSGIPIAQINVDGKSRSLTDIEKDAGFTNPTSSNQSVSPPNTSIAYPPLWSGPGPVPVGGYPIPTDYTACPYTPGVWSTNSSGTAQYTVAPILAPMPNSPGYPSAVNASSLCKIGSDTYRLYSRAIRCANGYSGASCTLQDSSKVLLPEDGTCQISRVGNKFSIDSKDPDCTPTPGKSSPIPVFTNGGSTISYITKTDSGTRPTVATVNISNGQADVIVATPNITTPTYTNTTVSAAPPDATTGEAPVITTTSTTTEGLGPGATIINNSTTTTSGGDVTLNLPPNLAKSEDIAAVKDAITDLSVSPSAPFSPDPSVSLNDNVDSVTDLISNPNELPSIFSFSPMLPASVSAPLIGFSLAGNSFNIDISTWILYLRNFLGVLLYTLTPFTIFSILTRRED